MWRLTQHVFCTTFSALEQMLLLNLKQKQHSYNLELTRKKTQAVHHAKGGERSSPLEKSPFQTHASTHLLNFAHLTLACARLHPVMQ